MWEKKKIRIPALPCNILYFSADFKLKIFLYFYYIIAYDISVLEIIGVSITVSAGFFHFVGQFGRLEKGIGVKHIVLLHLLISTQNIISFSKSQP